MATVKVIDSTTWAALTQITLNEGEDLATKGLGADTYRCIRSDVASAAVTQWSATGVESNSEVGAPTVSAVSGSTVGDTATTDGSQYLSWAHPASNPTSLLIWMVASRASTAASQDALDDATNGRLRLIARSGGNYRGSASDGSTTAVVTNTNGASADELVAVFYQIDAGTDSEVAFMPASPGTWSNTTETTDSASLTNIGISGSTFNFPGDQAGTPPGLDVIRIGYATGLTAIDLTNATNRAALATSNGSVLTPESDASVLQGIITGAGGTVLVDMYGGATRFIAGTNDGSLTVSNSGTWT